MAVRNFFPLINHALTEKQKEEIFFKLKCDNIIYLPEKLNEKWVKISPEGSLNVDYFKDIISFLKHNAFEGDYVLVQGEFGATFYIVDFCFKKNLIPLYASSTRNYNEKRNSDGSVERYHIFRHETFRKYIKWEKTMNVKHDEKIRFFYEVISSRVKGNLKKVYLFGSHARGDATEKSDYDFVVVLKEKRDEDVQAIRETEVDFLDRFDSLSSALVYDENEWRRRQELPIGINVKREGIVL